MKGVVFNYRPIDICMPILLRRPSQRLSSLLPPPFGTDVYCRENGQNETSHNLLFDLSLTTATGTNIIMSWETTKGYRITVYNQQHMWDNLYREIILL
ncbi:hypothetical protein T06_4205 [Trichinella sp. T6]|nr:hypothetical protein T06_4205 [Trichinella sp. T6]